MRVIHPRDPKTDAEWQDAADLAHAMLHMQSAILYGLVAGLEINAERCEELLRRGAARGITPAAAAIERIVTHLASPR